MPAEEFAELHVDDPHLYRDHERGKGAELDVRAHTKSGEIINIEIQVNPEKAFKERITYYNAKIFGNQLTHGEPYSALNRTISVVIADYVLFDENADCFNRFKWYNPDNKTLLTNAQEINILELPKLPMEDDGTRRWQWLKLLKLREVNEMEAIARDNTAIKNVIVHVREMSADEYERRIAEKRDVEWVRQCLNEQYSKAEGIEIGEARGQARGIEIEKHDTARRMKADGKPVDEIIRYTGLSEEAIAAL
jgi:predicted transposase/invertase (TIGR01784 family)